MSELVALYKKHKHTTDKHGTHSYLPVYDKLFKRLKDNKNRILEIGIYRGDSLNLWAEYFTNSIIFGVDNNIAQAYSNLNSRVHTIRVNNAYNDFTLNLLKNIGKFDIIIDDGSHNVKDQKFVISNYCDLLTDDGILIIEDVQIALEGRYSVNDINNLLNCFPNGLKKYVYYDDRRNIANTVNDILIICDKGKL